MIVFYIGRASFEIGGRYLIGFDAIFESDFREFSRLRDYKNIDPCVQVDGAQRATLSM